uniref:Reverse transcriptase domain-containing protein n=1 Tax=Tanacetum cinerariifolium TaxID=118510 RepID=A0A6L2LCZ4_TANCI|nr:reverse transcriptase domain-containing protein [Tanacetum cinerariifolium]
MLGAARVQVPEDDLDDLKWTREKDRVLETVDPQFSMGSELLEIIDPTFLDLLLGPIVLWIWFESWIDFDEVLVLDFRKICLGSSEKINGDLGMCLSIIDVPPSPNHVFNFSEDEFEEDPQEEPKEEFEEDPEEDPEEDLEEELEAKAKDDVPNPATPPVGSPITTPPLSESSSDTEDVAPIVANEALEMPPIYEVGGPSYVSPFPPVYLHGHEIARLDDNTELFLSNVKYLKQREKKRKAEMEASSSKICKVKKCIDEIGQELGYEIQFSNLVEHRVTKLEDNDQEKAEEMEKIKKCLRTLETNYSLVIMPPKMMKRKAVKKMVKKQIAKAIEEYEKIKVNPGNTSGSGVTNTGRSVNVQGCTHKTFINVKPYPFNGTKGVVSLRRWIKKVEQVFEICKYAEEDKGDDIEAYNNCFHEVALVCPDLVPNEKKKIERYMKGFPKRIKGNITSSRPTTLHDAINLARELVEQAVQGKAARVNESNKRKWEEHQKTHPNNNNNPNNHNCNRNNNNNQRHQQNRRQETARAYAVAPAEGKFYAGTLSATNATYTTMVNALRSVKGVKNWVIKKRIVESDFQALNEGACARAYVVVENPQQNPNVVTGTFLLNDHYASILFDSGVEKSFVSTEFTPFINIFLVALNTSYEVELADGKIVSTNTVLCGCTLALFSHMFKIDLLPTRLGSFDVIVGMDWLSYHRAVIVCYMRIVCIPLMNAEILEIHGERPKKDPNSLSCIKVDEKRLDDIRTVCDFPELFSDDLTGLPPMREIEFHIDLIPGALPFVKSPYRLAPSEMLELSNQLKELQEKGLAGYYRRFIENFSKIAKPLTQLTQKNKAYVWGDKQEKAFLILKEKLCNAPVLALPDGPNDFVVYCDASNQGFGCMLMQRGKIPSVGGTRKLIMDEARTSRYSVHLGADKMYYNLKDLYWWPGMKRYISKYVSKCLTCSKIKAEHKKPSGLLQQPEIPEWKWEMITMDLVTKLPKSSSGHDAIWVMVDRLTKLAHFLPIREDYKTKKLERIYINEIVVRHGVPVSIISDGDGRFASHLWKALQKALDAQVPLEEIKIAENLRFVEEPIEIVERDVKKRKQRRITLVKVRWNSRQGAKYTWEREDQFKTKYPHLFTPTSSAVAS